MVDYIEVGVAKKKEAYIATFDIEPKIFELYKIHLVNVCWGSSLLMYKFLEEYLQLNLDLIDETTSENYIWGILETYYSRTTYLLDYVLV